MGSDEWHRQHHEVRVRGLFDGYREHVVTELGYQTGQTFGAPAVADQDPLASRGGMCGNSASDRAGADHSDGRDHSVGLL